MPRETRRANRGGYTEHDDFEGLPVRQWREEKIHIAPPPPEEKRRINDIWSLELPHGMPKDSHLLSIHSQDLLRAARSGRMYKRPPPPEEEEPEADGTAPEKQEKKEEGPAAEGYTVRMWKQIPRNAEGSTISYLGKRRKGTITLISKAIESHTAGHTITRATVRRVDAAGNPYTQEVTLVAGQQIEGEIISTSVVPVAGENGDGPSQQSTPARRRPPPPKRKAKSSLRGRKRKLPLPPTSQPVPAGHAAESSAAPPKPETEGASENKPDREDSANQDSEMADNSVAPSDDDDDGDDGDDGDEAAEEEAGESGEGGENPMRGTVARASTRDDDEVMTEAQSQGASVPDGFSLRPVETDSSGVGFTPTKRPIPPMNPLNLPLPAATMFLASGAPRLEGSPLKNVVLRSPTEPSPDTSPITASFAQAMETDERRDVAMAEEAIAKPFPPFPPPAPAPGTGDGTPSAHALDLQASPTGMTDLLLAEHARPEATQVAVTIIEDDPAAVDADPTSPPTSTEPPVPAAEVAGLARTASSSDMSELPPEPSPVPAEPPATLPAAATPPPAPRPADDDEPDLLGGLEAELNRQAAELRSVGNPSEQLGPTPPEP